MARHERRIASNGEKILVNLDQYCPLCYQKTKTMRNVYRPLEDKTKNLYCEVHGFVMSEDDDLIRYQVKGETSPVPTSEIGEAVIGEAVIL